MENSIILLLALAIDLALGEPPNAIHPVVWMGKVISLLEKGNKGQSPKWQFLYGVGMLVIVTALFTVPVYLVLQYAKGWGSVWYVVAGAILLKPAFSLKGLRLAALKVKNLLAQDKLDEARFELRALVGRDTSGLPVPRLVSATVESVAESACDSVVAPLFYFLIFGVPGAIAYRAVNTADSMIGYHGKYEYLGRAACKVDEILNYIPARLTALLLVLASFLARKSARSSWRVAVADHSKTPSRNGGWPMAAIAGALDVQLEKVGQYKLGRANNALAPETIDVSLRLMQIAALAWALICVSAGVIYYAVTR